MSAAVKAAAVALDAALVPEGATFDALATLYANPQSTVASNLVVKRAVN